MDILKIIQIIVMI